MKNNMFTKFKQNLYTNRKDSYYHIITKSNFIYDIKNPIKEVCVFLGGG